VAASGNQLHSQFNRTFIAEKDFAEAEDYLRSVDLFQSDSVQRAIVTAAVISYGRPFTTSDTGGRSTPSLPGAATRHLTAEQRGLHSKLLTLRHEAGAHSAFARKATSRARGNKHGFVIWSRPFDLRTEIDVPAFLELVVAMRKHCINTAFRLNLKLVALEPDT